jgi:hypothetical protein
MTHDILEDLKGWHDQLVLDAKHRRGELPLIEVELLRRAIAKITHLRGTSQK